MTRFHSFRLDTANQSLGHRGVRVELTPKAFDVLRYLVDHAGRLVTPAELLEALWPNTYVNPEGLRSYIREIRKVLGDRPNNPVFIKTLPKRGYLFIAPVTEESTAGQLEVTADATKKIVDRKSELLELDACFREAMRGQRQIVFVTGEVGIGKTALVDEFQRRVSIAVPEVRIARGQCLEGYGGKEPYYAVLEAVGALCQGPEGAAVVELLATQAPTWLVQFPALVKQEQRETLQREILGATRTRMLREISDVLERITCEKPLLLLLEDLEWADVSTLDVISAIARRRRTAKLMFIGTYRPMDVVAPENPLTTLKQELLVHRLCSEIALGPLGKTEVGQYLAMESGGATVPEGLARLIYRYSEGNPLFMVAVLEHMQDQGLIALEEQRWQIKVSLGRNGLEVPENLRGLIELQIERLSAKEKRVLEGASLPSVDRLRFSVVARSAVLGWQPEAFEDVCEKLSRRHRILRSAGTRTFTDGMVSACYGFAHELYRAVCYERIAPARRARLHRRLGEWVEAHYPLNEAAIALADHFEQAGDWPRVIKYLQLAADMAARRFEPRRAAETLKHALELLKKLPQRARSVNEIEILEKLATVYGVLTEHIHAIESYEALTARAAHDRLIDVEVRALAEKAWVSSWTNSQHSLEVVEQALSLSMRQEDALLRAKGRARCFAVRLWQRWDSQDAEAFHNAFSEIIEVGDRPTLPPYLSDCGFVNWISSEYSQARQNLLESHVIQMEALDENPYITSPYIFGQRFLLPMSFLFLGEWGEALRHFEETIVSSDKNADNIWGLTARLFLAFVHLCAMDFAGALAICQSALPLVADGQLRPAADDPTPYPILLRVGLTLIGSAKIGLGKYEGALKHLLAAKATDRPPVAWDWWWQMPLEAGLTELWLAKGDLAQARRQAERFLSITLASAERTWRTLAREANSRVAMAELDMERAQECIAEGLTTMEGFAVPLAAWRAHATAFEVYSKLRDRALAERHLALSRETIMKLANSLRAEEPLRQIFLSAQETRRILGAGAQVKGAG